MKKILIIQTAFIGDTILATALAAKLKQYYPTSSVDFLLRKGNELLLQGNPLLNEILIWNKKENKYPNLIKVWRKVRSRKYDLVINLQRYWATGLLTAFSGAQETRGFRSNPLSSLFSKSYTHSFDGTVVKHEIFRNQTLIADITDHVPSMPKLHIDEASERNTDIYRAKPYITITPGSMWFTKSFPAEKWMVFLNEVNPDWNVYLLGGKNDSPLNEAIILGCRHPHVRNLAGIQSFAESFALMRTANMNYVNDSGPLHFCSALNAPVTAIFCSTSPSFGFGPLSDKSFVVETTEELSCKPCGVHGRKSCPQKHFSCAYGINTHQLLQTLRNDAV